MKYFSIRFQLALVSVLLFFTFAMMMGLVGRFNSRWDFTREKSYSLLEPTVKLLKELASEPIEVTAFYPHDDPARKGFEVFLKQCQMEHPQFKYFFYDPDRVPSLAKELQVRDLYTVILRYGNSQERIVSPTEENFTNALLRLAQPKRFEICFVAGHGEPSMTEKGRNGYQLFADDLRASNHVLHETILERDYVPEVCNALVIAGPHHDIEETQLRLLKKYFREGGTLLFLLDPMDQGEGVSFQKFMQEFGIDLGGDVVVDKQSRMVGGDFLIPLVEHYESDHPITHDFDEPTFYPVARSVRPWLKQKNSRLKIQPIAITGPGSWAEIDLKRIENGEAVFEEGRDLAGPLSLAVAVEGEPDPNARYGGRLVVVGDSDFLTNAYLGLSGNRDFGLNILQWLTRDDRFIAVRPQGVEFEPLYLMRRERLVLLGSTLGGLPFVLLGVGAWRVVSRKRSG